MIMVNEPDEIYRLYKQTIDTIMQSDAKKGDLIQPYNMRNVGQIVSPTLTTRPEGLKTAILVATDDGGARRMTPRECYRLMGIEDDDIDKLLLTGLGDSRHWKLAGNSIVVDCMVHMFDNLFNQEYKKTTLW